MVKKNHIAAPATVVRYAVGVLTCVEILGEKANLLDFPSNSDAFKSLSWIDKNIFYPIVQINSPFMIPIIFASAIIGGIVGWEIGRIIEKYVCHLN
jgi:hypothetical protein